MKRNQKIDWDKVDWSKTNMEIAFATGACGQGYVASVRRRLGKPNSPKAGKTWAKIKNFASPKRKKEVK